MDYKEKYEQALKAARSLCNITTSLPMKEYMESIFPELKETNDEKIIKALHNYFWNAKEAKRNVGAGASNEEILAWLEKQGKIADEYEDKLDRCACESWDKGYKAALEKQGVQKSEVKYVYPKFRVGDVIVPIKPNGYYVPERVQYISKGYYNCKSDDNKAFSSIPICSEDEYKLYEQKPAWSEEDERIYNEILDFFLGDIETRCATIDKQRHFGYWLKSLKPRWKPTKEQMYILNWVANTLLSNDGIVEREAAKILNGLYNDLKSL